MHERDGKHCRAIDRQTEKVLFPCAHMKWNRHRTEFNSCALKVRIQRVAARAPSAHGSIGVDAVVVCKQASKHIMKRLHRVKVYRMIGSYVKLFKFDHSKLYSKKNGHFCWSLHPFIICLWDRIFAFSFSVSVGTEKRYAETNETHREKKNAIVAYTYVGRRRNSFSCNENTITPNKNTDAK